MEQRISI